MKRGLFLLLIVWLLVPLVAPATARAQTHPQQVTFLTYSLKVPFDWDVWRAADYTDGSDGFEELWQMIPIFSHQDLQKDHDSRKLMLIEPDYGSIISVHAYPLDYQVRAYYMTINPVKAWASKYLGDLRMFVTYFETVDEKTGVLLACYLFEDFQDGQIILFSLLAVENNSAVEALLIVDSFARLVSIPFSDQEMSKQA